MTKDSGLIDGDLVELLGGAAVAIALLAASTAGVDRQAFISRLNSAAKIFRERERTHKKEFYFDIALIEHVRDLMTGDLPPTWSPAVIPGGKQ